MRYFKNKEIEKIRKNPNDVDWLWVSCKELSEGFIREFADKVDWNYISWCQKLSEEFIREFSDKVDWEHVSKYQKLSEGFILEFYDRVNWGILYKENKINKGTIERMNGEQKLYMIMNYRELWKK